MSAYRGLIQRVTRVGPPNVVELPRTGAPPPTPPQDWLPDEPWGDGDDPGEPPKRKPKLKWLRLVFIFARCGLLPFVSFVFGMMMPVSRALPQLENRTEFKHAKNSVLLDDKGKPLGVLS